MSFGFVRSRIFWVILCLALLLLVFFPQFASAAGLTDTLSSFFRAFLGGVLRGSKFFVWVGQSLFLKVIDFTILEFAKSWRDGLLSNFSVAWQVLRDLVNLVIVVLFVLTTIVTAFGDKAFGFNRKSLIYLIGAAVFVNFSAFFTLLVIDISHIIFMLFFNALPLDGFGSLSPFSGYDSVLSEIGTTFMNLVVALIGIVVNWFVMLGLLFFSIILVERYVIAMFLVLLSPIAVLGFFAKRSGGNVLTKKVISFYNAWEERIQYVFSTPVVLVLGFVLLMGLVRHTLGEAADPSNFVQLLGATSDEGRDLLIKLTLGSLVLIYGIFKVGSMAKDANILGKNGIGGFKFGEFMQKHAWDLAKGKPLVGASKAAKKALSSETSSEFANKWGGRFARRFPKAAKWGVKGGHAASSVGEGVGRAVGGTKRTAQDAVSVGKGFGKMMQGDEVEHWRDPNVKKKREERAKQRKERREKRVRVEDSVEAQVSIRKEIDTAVNTGSSKDIVDLVSGPLGKSIDTGWRDIARKTENMGAGDKEKMYREMSGNSNVPSEVLSGVYGSVQAELAKGVSPMKQRYYNSLLEKMAGNKSTSLDDVGKMLKSSEPTVRAAAVTSFNERTRDLSDPEQKKALDSFADVFVEEGRTVQASDYDAYTQMVRNSNTSEKNMERLSKKLVSDYAAGSSRSSGKTDDEVSVVLEDVVRHNSTSSAIIKQIADTPGVNDRLRGEALKAMSQKTDSRTGEEIRKEESADADKGVDKFFEKFADTANTKQLLDFLNGTIPASMATGLSNREKQEMKKQMMDSQTEDLLQRVFDRAVSKNEGELFESVAGHPSTSGDILDRIYREVNSDIPNILASNAKYTRINSEDEVDKVFIGLARSKNLRKDTAEALLKYATDPTNAARSTAGDIATHLTITASGRKGGN